MFRGFVADDQGEDSVNGVRASEYYKQTSADKRGLGAFG